MEPDITLAARGRSEAPPQPGDTVEDMEGDSSVITRVVRVNGETTRILTDRGWSYRPDQVEITKRAAGPC